MNNKHLFTPNNEKKLYEIKIEVFENCSNFQVLEASNGERHANYQHVIGVIETTKQRMMWEQMNHNINVLHLAKPKAKNKKK